MVSSVLHGASLPFAIHGRETVHGAFEAQAHLTPQAITVRFGDEALTYRELDQRANQLAHHLRAQGVRPGHLVGLAIDPSIALLVGVLGTLKAGAAYVPLDPQYPLKRLEHMITDARPSVVLTQERTRPGLPQTQAPLICVDTDWDLIAKADGAAPRVEVTPTDLAYAIYTSGSTGLPKAALVEHRGVVNYLSWCLRAYDVEGGIGAPVHSSLSFDLTVTSLLAPIVAGRTTTLLPPSLGVGSLARTAAADRDFSLIKLTPLHLELLGQQVEPARLNGWTRALVIGGENLLTRSVALWREVAPRTKLFNEYGPTETVVGCCVFEAKPGEQYGAAVPIGTPIQNMRLYVLDEHQAPVPPGDEGELYIGGVGVARGYLNRPELTSARFLDDPLGGAGKVYRTGDLVRCLADGNLEFLGRLDEQVKVKGHRVELGEIESVLRGHPGIANAAVVVIGAGAAAQIVALIVARGDAPGLLALKQHCAERLPRYMVVDKIKVVESLPSTVNGKVDKQKIVHELGGGPASPR